MALSGPDGAPLLGIPGTRVVLVALIVGDPASVESGAFLLDSPGALVLASDWVPELVGDTGYSGTHQGHFRYALSRPSGVSPSLKV